MRWWTAQGRIQKPGALAQAEEPTGSPDSSVTTCCLQPPAPPRQGPAQAPRAVGPPAAGCPEGQQAVRSPAAFFPGPYPPTKLGCWILGLSLLLSLQPASRPTGRPFLSYSPAKSIDPIPILNPALCLLIPQRGLDRRGPLRSQNSLVH